MNRHFLLPVAFAFVFGRGAQTFTRDVAPIVFDACVSCHRAGGPGPFPLTTYDEVRRRATQIAQVTRTRFMPPWKVTPEVGHFAGQRLLTSREIALIDQWAANGTPEGDPQALPLLPKHADGWLLGKPDLIVKPDAAFSLPAQQTDAFRIFAIKLPVTKRTYVTGIEFHPGNPRVVHHANIRIDRTPTTRRLDEADPLPGYDGLMPRTAEYPEGHFLGWTPGQIAPLVQPELAWTLDPGSDLVVQLHMPPTGAAEDVWPEIGFYFTERLPQRVPTILRLGSQGIDIPAGEPRYVIRDSYVLPVDAQLLAIQPHAHYRAREIRGLATFPDGTSKLVMHIEDWDFRWQHVYREETPIPLPKGTRLSMEYTYDNSASNVRNPERRWRVFWGHARATDGDHGSSCSPTTTPTARMSAEITAKMTGEDIVGYETMLKVTNDASSMTMSRCSISNGFAANAVRHLGLGGTQARISRGALQPGAALAQAGCFDDAIKASRCARDLTTRSRTATRTCVAREGDVAEALTLWKPCASSEQSAKPAGLAEALAQRRLRSGDRHAGAGDEAAFSGRFGARDIHQARGILETK
jgi:hypothetical protein